MAVYNEILVGRINRFLQKLLGIKGGPPAPSLAGDVMTVLPLFVGVESFLHQGWETFEASDAVAAIALNFSKVKIRNPAGSNVVAVIEKLQIACTVATPVQLRIAVAGADFGGVLAFDNAFDNRGRLRSTVVVSDENANAVFITGTIIAQPRILGNTTLDLILTPNQEIPLLPGRELQIAANVVNQNLDYAVWWRERFLEETERT